MQCPDCGAVYSSELTFCPRCSVAARPSMPSNEARPTGRHNLGTSSAVNAADPDAKKTSASTLIEFPRNGRTPIPAWRKELSERVREVQARKAREAEYESGVAFSAGPEPPVPMVEEITAEPPPVLGLVPQPEVNPIVARAMKRIEDARRSVYVARSCGGAALAVARAVEEPLYATAVPVVALTWPMPVANPILEPAIEVEPEIEANESSDQLMDAPQTAVNAAVSTAAISETVTESFVEPGDAHLHQLPLIPASETARLAVSSGSIFGLDDASVIDDDYDLPAPPIKLRRHDEAINDESTSPLAARATAGVLDLMLVIFVTSPFAAVIELTDGDWSNYRVWGALLAIGGILLLLYQASAVALSGRTWGMSLFSMRVADADFGSYPTFGQSLARGFFYLISIATLGLPFLYTFFNQDRMTAHDRISGTVVVRGE